MDVKGGIEGTTWPLFPTTIGGVVAAWVALAAVSATTSAAPETERAVAVGWLFMVLQQGAPLEPMTMIIAI